METKPTAEAGDNSIQNALKRTQESSRCKLRDLRPEKDPMGAGRNRHQKTGARGTDGDSAIR